MRKAGPTSSRATLKMMTSSTTTPLTLVLLLCLSLLVGRHPTAGTFCGVDSRPHPKGICGSKLIRALRNLCFLLSHEYPSIFSSRSIHKRSSSSAFSSSSSSSPPLFPMPMPMQMQMRQMQRQMRMQSLDGIPLEAFAQMELPGAQEHHATNTGVHTDSMRKLFLSLMPRVQSLMPEIGEVTSNARLMSPQQQRQQQRAPGGPNTHPLLQATKRVENVIDDNSDDGAELAPRIQKRTMVCECCYNACQATTLAQYCP